MATSAPGATNLVTPIADAYMDCSDAVRPRNDDSPSVNTAVLGPLGPMT
jgi:hypothetical protein